MKPLLFALPGNEDMTELLAARLDGEIGSLDTRSFPDGEDYVRIASDVVARSVVFVCTLN